MQIKGVIVGMPGNLAGVEGLRVSIEIKTDAEAHWLNLLLAGAAFNMDLRTATRIVGESSASSFVQFLDNGRNQVEKMLDLHASKLRRHNTTDVMRNFGESHLEDLDKPLDLNRFFGDQTLGDEAGIPPDLVRMIKEMGGTVVRLDASTDLEQVLGLRPKPTPLPITKAPTDEEVDRVCGMCDKILRLVGLLKAMGVPDSDIQKLGQDPKAREMVDKIRSLNDSPLVPQRVRDTSERMFAAFGF